RDDAAHPAVLDDDLDRLPAERDLAAARPDRARPRLHEPLHAADLVVVGDEGAALRVLEELHQPADGCLLWTRMEDDRRQEEERAARAGMADVGGDPRAEPLRDRRVPLGGARAREARDDRGELVDGVRRAFEEVLRRAHELVRAPAAALEDASLGEA